MLYYDRPTLMCVRAHSERSSARARRERCRAPRASSRPPRRLSARAALPACQRPPRRRPAAPPSPVARPRQSPPPRAHASLPLPKGEPRPLHAMPREVLRRKGGTRRRTGQSHGSRHGALGARACVAEAHLRPSRGCGGRRSRRWVGDLECCLELAHLHLLLLGHRHRPAPPPWPCGSAASVRESIHKEGGESTRPRRVSQVLWLAAGVIRIICDSHTWP